MGGGGCSLSAPHQRLQCENGTPLSKGPIHFAICLVSQGAVDQSNSLVAQIRRPTRLRKYNLAVFLYGVRLTAANVHAAARTCGTAESTFRFTVRCIIEETFRSLVQESQVEMVPRRAAGMHMIRQSSAQFQKKCRCHPRVLGPTFCFPTAQAMLKCAAGPRTSARIAECRFAPLSGGFTTKSMALFENPDEFVPVELFLS